MTALDDQRLLQPFLLPGERPLWTGRPQRGLHLRRVDVYLIPFSLLWTGIVVFWHVMVWTMRAPSFIALFGLPFLAIGLYLLVGRFFHDALIRSGLVYAVTNLRVIVLRTRFGRGLRSAELGYLPALELEEHGNGRGTLNLETVTTPDIFEKGRSTVALPALGRSLVFDRIEQPRRVYDLIRRETERRRFELSGDPSTPASIG